ncbi:YiiD C-terminal domain-containing protein [Chitinimonas sp.]|uniref:YiiD C-terminal domain-containing protein n=1 Tax=Chitinimonas sp. TaxID=1934313 RepID=UPI002F95AA83
MSRDWTSFLRSSMPLADAMAVTAQTLPDGRIALAVPLGPNVNDKGTGFGGSVATLATLAGWVEVQRQLDQFAPASGVEIVIQRGETHYLKPIRNDFEACAILPDATELERFLRLYARKGLARLALTVEVHCQGEHVAQFGGDYVASRNAA